MNITKYIGLKYVDKGRNYEGVDCWGLVRLFYRDELGILLPSYDTEYTSPNNRETVSQTIANHVGSWKRVDRAKFGDVLLFEILGLPLHTAIYLGHNDFLHAFLKTNSCIERLNSITWNRRLLGAYRWANT